MKRADIHTVEQLANMSDSSIDSTNMIGLMAFREKAKEHLAEKAKSSQYDKLAAQNAELVKRIGEAGTGSVASGTPNLNAFHSHSAGDSRRTLRQASAFSLPTRCARIKTPIHGCCCLLSIVAGACWLPSAGRSGNRG